MSLGLYRYGGDMSYLPASTTPPPSAPIPELISYYLDSRWEAGIDYRAAGYETPCRLVHGLYLQADLLVANRSPIQGL